MGGKTRLTHSLNLTHLTILNTPYVLFSKSPNTQQKAPSVMFILTISADEGAPTSHISDDGIRGGEVGKLA